MPIEQPEPLEVTGIYLLAEVRPDILAIIATDRFLPPAQLLCAIQALDQSSLDRNLLAMWLGQLKDHPMACIRNAIGQVLGSSNEIA